MIDALALVALALAALGVVGGAVPVLPGGLFSLAGVYLYWWSTGYADPGPLALAALTAVGVLVVVVDYAGEALAARAGGASWTTTGVAAVVGFALFFVAGPVGVAVGIAGTVFALEFVRHRDPSQGARAALFATAGVLASAVMQVLLTATLFLALLLVVLV